MNITYIYFTFISYARVAKSNIYLMFNNFGIQYLRVLRPEYLETYMFNTWLKQNLTLSCVYTSYAQSLYLINLFMVKWILFNTRIFIGKKVGVEKIYYRVCFWKLRLSVLHDILMTTNVLMKVLVIVGNCAAQ